MTKLPPEPERLPFSGGPSKKAARIDDFVDLLPQGVMPIGKLYLLQQASGFLLVKSYDHGQKVQSKHKYIFQMLVKLGELPDSPAHITVACVWGLGPTKREYQIFNYQGEGPVVATDIDGWRNYIRSWFKEQRW